MDVIWKPIPNFSRYEASNTGHIRTKAYKSRNVNNGMVKVLKPAKTKDGYLKTMILEDSGKYRSWMVHRWVAAAFYGWQEGKEVNHINGIKDDNRPENLEWVTRSENCQHSFDTGLQKPKIGSLNGHSKLTERDVMEIRKVAEQCTGRYYGRKALADRYGVSEAHIKDIVTRRRGVWYHV